MSSSSSRWDCRFHSYVLTIYIRIYWFWELVVFYSLVRRVYICKVSVQLVWYARGGALLINMHIFSSINRKVSRWVVGVSLIYSAPCYIYAYTYMSTLIAEYFISKILLNPLLRDRVVAHPINYPQESLIFAYRVSLMCRRSINNMSYIKIYEYVRIFFFWGSFAQLKCDGFFECMNRSMYHTLERNEHQKVRAKFLAWQLQSCLALRTRNKNWLRAFCLKIILIRL